jgi:hypothetical protein
VGDFYFERTFAAPLTAIAERSLIEELVSHASDSNARLVECFIDAERHRVLCRLEADAPDAACARVILLCTGSILAPAIGHPAANPTCPTTTCLVDVIAECSRDDRIGMTSLAALNAACAWCMEAFRVQPGPVALAAGDRRVIAFFRAPDAEAVRLVYRHANVHFDRIVAVRRLEIPASPHANARRRD